MNIRLYFKQAWHLLRESPVLSGIAIFGTALSVCMIMVMVITYKLQNSPITPEGNRDRTLYVRWMTAQSRDGNGTNNGCMSYDFAKAAFKSLKTPEAVTVATPFAETVMVSAPGDKSGVNFDMKLTDEDYWTVFDHKFIAGAPYTKADVDAALSKVVITDFVAKKLFGTTDVIGKSILVNYVEGTVVGVVQGVSSSFEYAYGQVWMPLTTNTNNVYNDPDKISGIYSTYILAHSSEDFEKIRTEAEEKRKAFNAGTSSYEANYRGQPDTHLIAQMRGAANESASADRYIQSQVLKLVLLLLIPALNLSGIMGSRMRKRKAELGVRRAFGAAKSSLVSQIFWEGLLQTLIGGAVGLLLSYIAVYALREMLMSTFFTRLGQGAITINPMTLLTPSIFLTALLFCFILNLLSALLPAWLAARRPIVDSLQER